MTPREYKMVGGLEDPVRSIVLHAFEQFDVMYEGSRWRISLPGRHACRRTAEEQHVIFMRGRKLVGTGYKVVGRTRTKCDGFRKKSYHQSGFAVDIGIRDTWTNRFVWYKPESGLEVHETFRSLVAFLEQAGMDWAGRWPDPWDWHHFQMPKGA